VSLTLINGQPFRLRPVRRGAEALARAKENKERVWYTRAVDIANYCFTAGWYRTWAAERILANDLSTTKGHRAHLPRAARSRRLLLWNAEKSGIVDGRSCCAPLLTWAGDGTPPST